MTIQFPYQRRTNPFLCKWLAHYYSYSFTFRYIISCQLPITRYEICNSQSTVSKSTPYLYQQYLNCNSMVPLAFIFVLLWILLMLRILIEDVADGGLLFLKQTSWLSNGSRLPGPYVCTFPDSRCVCRFSGI